jgi:hypothetical protein
MSILKLPPTSAMMFHRFCVTSRRQSLAGFSRLQGLALTCTRRLDIPSINGNYSTVHQGTLLSASQLKEAINSNAPPVVLDCTWFMPNVARDAFAEFKKSRIPGSRFFNLDEVTDKSSPYPHMLPCSEDFAKAIGNFHSFIHVTCRGPRNSSTGDRVAQFLLTVGQCLLL